MNHLTKPINHDRYSFIPKKNHRYRNAFIYQKITDIKISFQKVISLKTLLSYSGVSKKWFWWTDQYQLMVFWEGLEMLKFLKSATTYPANATTYREANTKPSHCSRQKYNIFLISASLIS